ncbi:MAG: F0F1 ATP synthase subunit A [Clostridia bacterium]
MLANLQKLNNVLDNVKPRHIFSVGGFDISSTVITTWCLMVLAIVAILFLTRDLKVRPTSKRQLVLEYFVSFIDNIMEDTGGKEAKRYTPLVGGFFLSILILNLAWFIPFFRPPTMDYNLTFALGIMVFFISQTLGIYHRGIKNYFKKFIYPTPILLPINILEEFIKPVSLSLRLFGNMFADEMLVVIIGILVPLVLPVPIQLLGLLTAGIQAFVFSLLLAVYIGEAMGVEE